jgi:thioredoxin-like negative regulator of GroEL
MDAHNTSQPSSTAIMEAGQQALERGAWEGARSAFQRALSTSEPKGSAEIFSGLAEAMWWLGEIREALEH